MRIAALTTVSTWSHMIRRPRGSVSFIAKVPLWAALFPNPAARSSPGRKVDWPPFLRAAYPPAGGGLRRALITSSPSSRPAAARVVVEPTAAAQARLPEDGEEGITA